MKSIILIGCLLVINWADTCCDNQDSEFRNKIKEYRLNSYNEMTRTVYEKQTKTWIELGEEMKTCCYNLPKVTFVKTSCPDDNVIACYNQNVLSCNNEIRILPQFSEGCDAKIELLYHEFLHHYLRCNYGETDHPDEYYYTDWYWDDIKQLQDELCD